MGKPHKGNRTKGNTRPSSSDHSAQLLSGRQLNGFIGFGSLEKETASYVPVTGQQVSDSVDSSVDSDFRMVMRKMLKRDAITRLKAMQSFAEYCLQKDIKIVKNILPFWPRLFNKLALDSDRRIREATHQANDKLFTKVKREIAPYLKHIMGVWLLGQCDLYAPAASAAQVAFTSNFQSTKQSEALMFCKNEIFSYFKDNLFEQTEKSMSDPHTTTPEDMENKYILVISATLQALKLFITTVQSKEHANIQDELYSIVAADKFWKYAKNKEPHIRASWFTLISSACSVTPDVFSGLKKRLATTVFSSLSESNPAVARSVWDSALSIVINFENCWEGLNIHKVALPHVWSLLVKGGKGNAHLIFPSLLPLLSKLPKEVLESEEFLLQFFPSFKKSLVLDTVKTSSSECDAILVSFFECLQYICFKRLVDVSAGPTILENILINEIAPLVDSSLYDPQSSYLATSEFYPLLTSLIKRMEMEYLNLDEEKSKHFLNVLTSFWATLHPITTKYFSLPEEKQESSLAFICYFYNCLLHPFDASKKLKKQKVRFIDEVEPENPPSKEHIPTSDGVELFNQNTSFHAIVKFCTLLCEKITTDCKLRYLKLFEEILFSASSSDLVNELVKVFSENYNYDADSAFGFFQNVMLKWVEVSDNDNDNLVYIFNSLFAICSHISENEAWEILNCCCKTNVLLLEFVLQRGLKSYMDMPFFQTWLKTSLWTSEIVGGFEELVHGKKFFCDSSAKLPICIYYRILTLCLSDTKPLLDDGSFETIVQLLYDLSEQLIGMEMNYDIELALNFIHDVTIAVLQNPVICWKYDATSKLVYLLFRINLVDVLHFQKSDFVSKMLFQILTAFVDSYIKTRDGIMSSTSLIYEMATELNSSIQSIKTHEEASHVLQHCLFLISSVKKAVARHKPELGSTLYVSYKLMDEMLPKDCHWTSLRKGLKINILPWVLKNRIFYPLWSTEEFDYNEEQTLQLTLVSHVISNILSDAIKNSNGDEMHTKFCIHYAEKYILHLLWFLTFCKGHGITEDFKGSMSMTLEENCQTILSFLPEGELGELRNKLFQLSLSDENWSFCLLPFGDILIKANIQKNADELFENISSIFVKKTVQKYVIRQTLIPYLSPEKKMFHLLELHQDILEMEVASNEDFLGKVGEFCCCLTNFEIELLTPDNVTFLLESLCEGGSVWCQKQCNLQPDDLRMVNFQMISLMSCIIQFVLPLQPNFLSRLVDLFSSLFKEALSKMYGSPKELLLLNQTIILFSSLIKVTGYTEEKVDPICERALPFKKEICENMIFLFKHVSEIFNKSKTILEVQGIMLNNLQTAVDCIPGEFLINVLKAQESNSDKQNLEEKEPIALHTFISLLTSNIRQLQCASHIMLLKAMPLLQNLMVDEVKTQKDDEIDDEIQIPAKLSPLIDLLVFLNEIVDSMLLDIKIGDLCTVIPFTDSYIYAMAYLFAWMELFEFFSASPAQVRLGYALHLEEKLKLMSSLFCNLFRLMPENPILCLKKGLKVVTPKKEDLKMLFIHPPNLNLGAPSSEEIQSIACYVYACALRKVPVIVRTWWKNLDPKSADLVNSFTSKYISGLLCMEEIQAVHDNEKIFENLTVQARPGCREVSATYIIDESRIELCIQLPVNYPLGLMTSERRGKVVIGQQEWRHWLMQLITVLSYQNGSILDGLHIWKKNLDKKFEGVEECTICYYILHSSTMKLPKLSCHVCKKKFHSTCLYKWFKSSNNVTCPLCRNEFTV